MNSSLKVCSGGLLEYLSYGHNGFARTLIFCVIRQPRTFLFLAIISSCFFLAVILLCMTSTSRRKLCRMVFDPYTTEPLNELTIVTFKETENLLSISRDCELTRSQSNDVLTNSLRACDILSSKLVNLHATETRPICLRSSECDRDRSVAHVTAKYNSKKRNFYRKAVRLTLQSCVIIPLLAFLIVSNILLYITSFQLREKILGLPIYIQNMSTLWKKSANIMTNLAYSIIIQTLSKDLEQANMGYESYLRTFYEKMKTVFAEEIISLYKVAKNDSKISVSHESLKQLDNLDTIRIRLSRLCSVAPNLGKESIKSTMNDYHIYSQELARFSSHPLFSLESSDVHIVRRWRDNPLLNLTGSILCRHAFQNKYLNSCENVEKHLAKIYTSNDSWSRDTPPHNLANVVAYMRIPELLNAEKFVQLWLPVGHDPPGGIVLLFNELLVPEIHKGRLIINSTISSVSNLIFNRTKIYVSLGKHFLILMTVSLTLIIANLCVSVIYLSRSCIKLQGVKRRLHLSTRKIKYREILPCFTRDKDKLPFHKSMLHWLYLSYFLTVFFCVFGIASIFVGDFGTESLCTYFIDETKQNVADRWIIELIKRMLSRIKNYRDVKSINKINLKYPYPVIKILNANCCTCIPLLKSVGMERPLNLTAILFSDWLNETLHKIWHRDVWPKMLQANLSMRLPRANLTKTFFRIRKTLQLDEAFDNLKVGSVYDYLPKQATDYYTPIALALKSILVTNYNNSDFVSREVYRLFKYYSLIGQLVKDYENAVQNISQSLTVVEQNKYIMKELESLVTVADFIFRYLNTKKNKELMDLFTNMTAHIWIISRPLTNVYIIPLLHRILDVLLPFSDLCHAYHETVSPICGAADNELKPAIFEVLRKFGSRVCLSTILILFLSIACVHWVKSVQYPSY